MALQTNYATTLSAGFAGMVADGEPSTIVSRTLTGAALGFGKAVVQGSGDTEVTAPAADRTKFLGISVRDQAADPKSPNAFRVGDNVPVMTKGVVFVIAGEAVAAGDPVAFVPASGDIVSNPANAVAIANARFDTSGAAGQLVKLRLA